MPPACFQRQGRSVGLPGKLSNANTRASTEMSGLFLPINECNASTICRGYSLYSCWIEQIDYLLFLFVINPLNHFTSSFLITPRNMITNVNILQNPRICNFLGKNERISTPMIAENIVKITVWKCITFPTSFRSRRMLRMKFSKCVTRKLK